MLIPCHECGHTVSNKARSCPSCGILFSQEGLIVAEVVKSSSDVSMDKTTTELVTVALLIIGWFFPFAMIGGLIGGTVVWIKGYDNGITLFTVIFTDILALMVWYG